VLDLGPARTDRLTGGECGAPQIGTEFVTASQIRVAAAYEVDIDFRRVGETIPLNEIKQLCMNQRVEQRPELNSLRAPSHERCGMFYDAVRLGGSACAVERAADPLHCARIDPKSSGDLAARLSSSASVAQLYTWDNSRFPPCINPINKQSRP